jgi:hypothetical protein
MVNSFADVEPVVFNATTPLCCPQAEAMLTPGNWAVFANDDTNFHQSEEDQQDVLVGLILKTDPSKEEALLVNVCIPLTKFLIRSLRILLDCNPLSRWIPQMLRTTRSKWITSNSVSSIAWVFSQSSIDGSNEGHQGMANLFLLDYDDTGKYVVRGCRPFCSGCTFCSRNLSDCYQERVWNGLQTMRAEISRHLGRCSEKQGLFARVSSNIVVGREAWRFLILKVGKAVRFPLTRSSRSTKRLLSPGMVLSSTPIVYDSVMVKFETEHELSMLSSVLGELVTVEARKRRPKHGVDESLHVNDAINVVAGSLEREEPFRHRTNKQGVDLIYDGSNHVRIRIRYEKYQHPPVIGDSCPSTILRRVLLRKIPLLPADGSPQTSSDNDSDDDASNMEAEDAGVAKVGMEFSKDDTLCRIRSFGSVIGMPPLATAVVFWPNDLQGKVERFELWRVERWIKPQQQDEWIIGRTLIMIICVAPCPHLHLVLLRQSPLRPCSNPRFSVLLDFQLSRTRCMPRRTRIAK